MSRFIESIGCFDGNYPLLNYHQQRVDQTFAAFFPNHEPFKIKNILPKLTLKGKVKVRLVYDENRQIITHEIYQTPTIRSLKLVVDDGIDYGFKYEDRDRLQQLYKLKDTADDILIIKNGCITDTHYANVCLWDGNHWYTPQTCLLNGVRRQSLIKKGAIKVAEITRADLSGFEKISLINAMNDLGELVLKNALL